MNHEVRIKQAVATLQNMQWMTPLRAQTVNRATSFAGMIHTTRNKKLCLSGSP